jgi:predicted metalloprotease with PDZ domain
LLWLQVDSLMREQSKGARSLDTFAAEFYGPPAGAITVKPYSYEELIVALNHVVPNDWNALLQKDVQATRPAPVSPGLAAAGWTVTYNDEPNQAMVDEEAVSEQMDLSTSIGLVVDQDGTVADIVPGSAAAIAGLSPSIKLMGVNNRVYSGELLRQAIVNAESDGQPIKLLCLSNSYYAEYSVYYNQGLRYPHLSRIAGKTDFLKVIIQPRGVSNENK